MTKFRLGRLFRPFNRLAGDRSGVSAVEFAMILPIMVSLYLGGNEIGTGLTISRKVAHVSSSLSDLVAQSKTITDTDMTNILDAAAAVITPYSQANLTLRLSLIKVDAAGTATVMWSDARNTTALAAGSVVTTVPAEVKTANTYLIAGEVHYDYLPTIGYVMTGHFDLHDTFYLRPRLSSDVKRPPNYT